MGIRKQGLLKVAAGAGILLAFVQASALQSLTGGPTGIAYLLSLFGPPLCVISCAVGAFELVSGKSFGVVWQGLARRGAPVLLAAVLATLAAAGLAAHLIFAWFAPF